MAIPSPTQDAQQQYLNSCDITEALTNAIVNQTFTYPDCIIDVQLQAKAKAHKSKQQRITNEAELLKQSLPPSLTKAMDLAQEPGASSWLTSLPIDEFGFALHKGAFHDAIALRYNWDPLHTPLRCDCGTKFSVEHALSCSKGGFPSNRHNDITANLLSEVCSDVTLEPELQLLTGETLSGACANTQDGARLDIAAHGLWGGRFEKNLHRCQNLQPSCTFKSAI